MTIHRGGAGLLFLAIALSWSMLAAVTPASAAITGRVLILQAGDLYAANADGSSKVRLTSTGGVRDAQWSPDGAHIAFERIDDIWTMSAAGKNVARVTSNAARESSPTWSPDGRTLAFVSNRSGLREIYRLRSTAPYGTAARVTNSATHPNRDWCEELDHYDVRWSPTNAGLVVTTIYCRGYDAWVETVNASTGATVKKLQDGAMEPEWSRDGKRVAVTDRSCYDPTGFSYGNLRVAVIGGAKLTPCESRTDGPSRYPDTSDPVWSPDGLSIAYLRGADTWIASNTGANKRKLIAGSVLDWH